MTKNELRNVKRVGKIRIDWLRKSVHNSDTFKGSERIKDHFTVKKTNAFELSNQTDFM